MDRLEAMAVLLAAVETGSLSAAGRRLRMPLPTVSRKVAELEAHLGTRLLMRSTRRLTLTDAGAAYAAACKRILEQVGDAERAAGGEYSAPKGELIVTAPIAFGRLHVLPVVDDFLAAFPEISVRLMLGDRNAHLIDDDIDMAVRIGALPDSSMVATRVGALRRVVCGSPAYFAARHTPKVPQDLSELACITFDALTSATEWYFPTQPGGAEKPVPVRSRLSVNTAEAAVDAAVAGVGVTRVLSYQAARAVKAGLLQIVLAAFEPEPSPANLVHAAQGSLPLKMRGFLDFAAPRLRHALAAVATGL
jgi:DNA-binding transcriptional LysR family regulator